LVDPLTCQFMDIRHIGVLMGSRDVVRRLAAEVAGVPAGTP